MEISESAAEQYIKSPMDMAKKTMDAGSKRDELKADVKPDANLIQGGIASQDTVELTTPANQQGVQAPPINQPDPNQTGAQNMDISNVVEDKNKEAVDVSDALDGNSQAVTTTRTDEAAQVMLDNQDMVRTEENEENNPRLQGGVDFLI